MKNSSKRHFIHDHELEKENMDNEDKEQLRRDIELNKLYLASQGCGIHKTAQLRLNIAKELLIALLGNNFVMSRELYKCDIVDSAIRMADRLLEKIKE